VCNRLETSCLPSDPTDPTLPPIAAAHHNESKKVVPLSAAKKRKRLKASPQFELIHVHDSGSFEQKLTQNNKCLQIALFLIDFIFSSIDDEPVDTVNARTELYFSIFNACCSSRRFVELCRGLLVLFDGPVPERDKVHELLTVLRKDSNINLLDCVSGKVSLVSAQIASLRDKIYRDVNQEFPKTSIKKFAHRDKGKQLAIMGCVVLSVHVKSTGKELDTSKKSLTPKPNSAVRKALLDPMVVAPEKAVPSPHQSTASTNSGRPRKQPRIEALCRTVLDELGTIAPTNLDQQMFAQAVINETIPPVPCDSHHSDLDERFDPKQCRIAAANEVAPFAPRVHVEGELCETNVHCAPLECHLFRDLKSRCHGFKCDDLGLKPSIGKLRASLDVPMAVSLVTDDVAVLRPGHVIFSKAFSKRSLLVDLPLCLKFVIEHGTANRNRDGAVSCDTVNFGSRIDFGCAGSGSTKISPGVWRPDQLCGVDVFDAVSEDVKVQIMACLASVCNCIQAACDEVQKAIGLEPLFNYEPRDDICGSALRNFLGAKVMRNKWMTMQVKCISRGDSTDRHKDAKNCSWCFYDKTGALCFIIRDAFGILWLLKFISNGRQVIGSYFDKLAGAETLHIRIKTHFNKLDVACAAFLEEHDGSFQSSNVLNWKIGGDSFWILVATGRSQRMPPAIVVRDFWLSAPVHIIIKMKLLGLEESKLLEIILLAAHQTSRFRFYYVDVEMVEGKTMHDIFKTHIELAEEAFGAITGGPKPRADPPGIDVQACFFPNDCSTKHKVIECLLSLLKCVNETPEENFNHVFLRSAVVAASKETSQIKVGAELGEFRLMLVLQMCALSSVVLHPSPKLLNLLCPIPGKGSANHLLDVNVKEIDHHDALRRALHHFNLQEFGDMVARAFHVKLCLEERCLTFFSLGRVCFCWTNVENQ
jgi:hypothetical protein